MMILWLMTALLVKHFVADFLLQFPSMLATKGVYLSRGGVSHAAVHGMLTSMVFVILGYGEIALPLGVLDLVIHYHVDYLKSKLNSSWSLDPSKNNFWRLMGLDQLIHGLTYVLLAALALPR